MADVEIVGEMPYHIDPNVEHVGVSKLRQLNATNIRNFKKMMVVQDNDTPLLVLLNYEQYLIMQNQLKQALETIRMLKTPGILQGLKDAAHGRVTPLEEVDSKFK